MKAGAFPKRQPWTLARLWPSAALAVLAFMACAATLLVAGPSHYEGDWPEYARVAANILRGCGVSLSDPHGAACIPHFGGNGLPGYPAFIAASWVLFGGGLATVLWAQAAVTALAAPRLAYATICLTGRPWAGLLLGVIVAVSPLHSFWSRHGLAELLTIGAAELLLAELALSLAERRLRVGPIALVMIIGIFLRLDFVAFLAPVAVIGLGLHRLGEAARRGLILAGLIAAPLGLWTVRNLAVGVSVLPPARSWMLPDGSIGPLDYQRWLKGWVTTERERSDATYFGVNQYSEIKIAPSAFHNSRDKATVERLLAELRTESGRPFPARIDSAFGRLADQAGKNRTWPEAIRLRSLQAWGLWRAWFQPLPPELRPPHASMAGMFFAAPGILLRAPVASRMEIMIWMVRFALGWTFLASWLVIVLLRERWLMLFALAVLALMAVKTAISVMGLFLEARYTATAIPAFEMMAVLTLSAAVRRWFSERDRRYPYRHR